MEELVCYDSLVCVSMLCFIVEDVELDGVIIFVGEYILVFNLIVNYDVECFDDFDCFDFICNIDGYFGYGFGVYYCVGVLLVWLEGWIVIQCLFVCFFDFQLVVFYVEL